MNVWNYESFDERMLILPDDVDLFFSELRENGFGVVTEAFSLSHNCLCENDVNLVRKLFGANKADKERKHYIDEVHELFDKREYSSAYNYLKAHRNKSNVEGIVCNTLRELAFLMKKVNEFFSQGPLCMENGWMNAQLEFSQNISEFVAQAKVKQSPMISFLDEARKFFDELCKSYIEARPEKKLKIISSCFLIACEFEAMSGKVAVATIYLHRAIETLFISWLIEDKAIRLNKDGKIDKDSYLYLLDYMEMVKKERVISDHEVTTVRSLNKLRNESKLAHGYSEPVFSEFNLIFETIKIVMSNDADVKKIHSEILNSLSLPDSIHKTVKNFLLDKLYVKKLALSDQFN